MIEVDYNEYKETIEENMKLLQTNHKLKEKYYLMRTNASQLAIRIDKAIEYIEEHYNYENFMYLSDEDTDKLLEILKGENKE